MLVSPAGYNERLRGKAMRLSLEPVGGWCDELLSFSG